MEKNVSRKKFLAFAAGAASLLAVPAFLKFSPAKKSKQQTAKMLTQDGRLVEIDAANIPAKKRKLAVADIHSWIRKKASL